MLYYERKFASKGYQLIAGVDEAGRGPLAGPVVSAAVILKTRRFENRIDDSKLLTALERENAFPEIKEKAYVGLGVISEKIIDRINILEATSLSMRRAISSLGLKPDFVLIDGNVPLDIASPFKNIIDGDAKSLSIACASIIAKVTRDRIMELYHKKWPGYGFRKHKGYGTKGHLEALRKLGPSPIQRLSFHYE
ncbi:MAG: ribonuclease HII [Omnitrophica WOR_2 bacterium RIFCSPHIGHO2_02_FULL_46_37]|nr:MAG: ribonuclease HII [Omnitrophica WOR_2 bacterium RIFCSPHIGHO2_02_FULL_46_37]